MTGVWSLSFRFPLLGRLALLRGLLRNLSSFRPRLGQTDGDRLLATLDLPPRAAALQSPGLALLHRASNLGGCLFRIFPCHDYSPSCRKIIFANEDGSRSCTVIASAAKQSSVWIWLVLDCFVASLLAMTTDGPSSSHLQL